MKTSELDGYLSTLVSVLVVPDATSADGVVRPLHQSFPDFLCQHGGRVHRDLLINAIAANARLTKHCLARLNKDLHVDMCDIKDPSLFNSEVQDLESQLSKYAPLALCYSCSFWPVHCLECIPTSGPGFEVPLGLLEFCHTHLLHWIELLSLTNGLNGILRVIPMLIAALEVTVSTSV
jgi:hypothetical protein